MHAITRLNLHNLPRRAARAYPRMRTPGSLPAKTLRAPVQPPIPARPMSSTSFLCDMGCCVGIRVAFHVLPIVLEGIKTACLPNTTLPPLDAPHKKQSGLTDKDLLRAVHSVFYSPQKAPHFNEMISIMTDNPIEKAPTGWIGKGACGTVSILTYMILKHTGFKPKIVGSLGDLRKEFTSELEIAVNNVWHSEKGPRHVWIEIDSLEKPAEKKPLWIDCTSRQFTGMYKTPANIETPHGIIGYKGDFLEATGPHQHHWEGATDITEFFQPYITRLAQELYTPISSKEISYLDFSSRDTLQLHLALRNLLKRENFQPQTMERLAPHSR